MKQISANRKSSRKKIFRLKSFITLFRLQTGATTALAPVFGYLLAHLTVYNNLNYIHLSDVLVLFFIGILIHIFLFVYNEYRDVEIDKLSADLQQKPLVSGVISKREALYVVWGSLILTGILVAIFYLEFWPVVLIILVTFFNAEYDIIGKKLPGADIFIAIGIFLSVLFGASTVTTDFGRLIIFTGMLGFMQIMFNNSVEGGLKDIDHDHIGGAKTIAMATGLTVHKGEIRITRTFKIYAFTLKIIHVILLLLLLNTPIVKNSLLNHPYAGFIITLLLLLILAIFSSMQQFLNLIEFDRGKMKRLFSIHEISTYFLVPIALSPLLGLFITLALLLVPFIWYITLNIVLYGHPLQPRV